MYELKNYYFSLLNSAKKSRPGFESKISTFYLSLLAAAFIYGRDNLRRTK